MSISIIGHDKQIAYLNSCRGRGTLAHAYLFHGTEHLGKLTIALVFAQSFFCSDAAKNDFRSACGQCTPCRAIMEHRHPSVIVLDTEHTLVSKKEARKEIPIEDIRELKRILSFAPQGDAWRLAIIAEADKMSGEAANAFLKLLEEPGRQTILILIAPHRDLVLPTLVSRTQPISFSTVSDNRLKELLAARDIDTGRHDEFLTIASGRPGVLIRLCQEKSYAAEARSLFQEIDRVIQSEDIVGCLHIASLLASEPVVRQEAIGWIMAHFRRLLTTGNLSDQARAVQALKRVDRIALLMDTTNVNPHLALDALFLTIIR